MCRFAVLLLFLSALAAPAAHAQQDPFAFGEPGIQARVDRTIQITTSENSFSVSSISVRAGETVEFLVTNAGEELHEFMITTADQYRTHLETMADMMSDEDGLEGLRQATLQDGDMMDEPNVIFVEPGFTESLIWTFSKAGPLIFACNVRDGSDRAIQGDLTVFPR